MTTVTVPQLLAVAPEFEGLSTTELETAIADAEAQCNADRWGRLYTRAVVLTAAHGLTVNRPGALPGGTEKDNRYMAERNRLVAQLGLTPEVL